MTSAPSDGLRRLFALVGLALWAATTLVLVGGIAEKLAHLRRDATVPDMHTQFGAIALLGLLTVLPVLVSGAAWFHMRATPRWKNHWTNIIAASLLFQFIGAMLLTGL